MTWRERRLITVLSIILAVDVFVLFTKSTYKFTVYHLVCTADICICFGVAALAFSLLLRPQDWCEKAR